MKESYGKGLADRPGPESYADDGNIVGVALARGTRRPAMELRNPHFRVPTSSCQGEGNMGCRAIGERRFNAAESRNPSMIENFKRENREVRLVSELKLSDVETVWIGQKTSQTVQLI